MSSYKISGVEHKINEELLLSLSNKYLPNGMANKFKKEFADSVKFLISDIELDDYFFDCDGIEVSVEKYYFLACLMYAKRNGYQTVIECEDDLKIFSCLDSVTEEIYNEFVEITGDEDGQVDNEYFMKWINEF